MCHGALPFYREAGGFFSLLILTIPVVGYEGMGQLVRGYLSLSLISVSVALQNQLL